MYFFGIQSTLGITGIALYRSVIFIYIVAYG